MQRKLKALGLVAASGAGLVLSGGIASASITNGTVGLVAGNNSGTVPLPNVPHPSTTTYGVQLQPTTAANGQTNNRANCPADSATGSTYVYTYLIPANEDVHTDNFSQGEPGFLADDPSNADFHALALTDNFGNFETNNNDAETAPGTGQILLPVTTAYDFGTLVSDLGIPTSTLTGTNGGNWVAGYTCFKDGKVVTDNWQFPVTFTANSADPSGFTWQVTSGPGNPLPEVGLPILLPLGGTALIVGGVAFTRRRRKQAQAA